MRSPVASGNTPFIIYALPRSRTYWLKHYLTYGPWYCGHDEVRHARTLDDVWSWLAMPYTGTIETAAAPFWRAVAGVKTVTVRRPVDDVVTSMHQFGLDLDWDLYRAAMVKLDRKLDQIEARLPGVMRIDFADLADEATCARLFEHCLGVPHDPAHWSQLAPLNIQCHMGHYINHAIAFGPQLAKLAATAKFHTLGMMNHGVTMVDQDDGLTIEVEDFAKASADAGRLIEQHCVAVGEAPDQGREKNWPLLHQLDAIGAVQTVTARCNGRMFGYLITILSPSLEATDRTVATHTAFFADPSFKNLGVKLQRVALDALRERGVAELYLHAGVRGSGPRMGALYKRLGAKPHGEWYKLDLR